MIRNIVFDFGGVLIQHDFPALFAAITGSKAQALHLMNNVLTPQFSSDIDRGIHPFSYYIEQKKRQWPEYKRALDDFERHYSDAFISETPDMRPLMERLKKHGYRLYGLSNWCSRVKEVMEKFSIFRLLDGALISYQVKLLKPERAIYEAFLEKFNIPAADCVFIDDLQANIDGARAAGMYGITFTSVPALRQSLSVLL